MHPERLAELRRQRDLVREHLAWLERQIADSAAVPVDAAAAIAPVAVPPEDADAMARQATESLRMAETYHPDPARAARDTRRGCLTVMALALGVACLILAAIFFTAYRDRCLLRAQPRSSENNAGANAPAPAGPRR